MSIIYADEDKIVTPLAIILGYYPNSDTILTAYEALVTTGLRKPMESKSNLEQFLELSEMVNDVEAEIQGGYPYSNIDHHMLFFQNKGKGSVPRYLNHNANFQEKGVRTLKGIMQNLRGHNSCLSIIADPKTDSLDRLKRYCYLWTSLSRVTLSTPNDFHDPDQLIDNSFDLFEYFDTIYSDPFTSLTEKMNTYGIKWSAING